MPNQTTDSRWEAPSLMVPITVEALVLTQASHQNRWSTAGPTFDGALNFSMIAPAPFNATKPMAKLPGGGEVPLTGVILHWTLPSALRRGTQAAPDGQLQFPALPNRWLVVRKSPCAPGQTDSWRNDCWVLESDYMDPEQGSSPFLDPHNPTHVTRIGRALPLHEWISQRTPAAKTFLNAVGAGDASFSTFVSNIRNVFSFTDLLTDVPPGPLTYLVVGWYAHPDDDPLAPTAAGCSWKSYDDWAARLFHLGWNLSEHLRFEEGVGPGYPARTVCHGMVYNVPWPGPDGELPPSSVPTPGSGTVAIGETAMSALRALIAHKSGNGALAQVLEALDLNLLPALNDADAEAQLITRLHATRFASEDGGSRWDLVAPEQPEPAEQKLRQQAGQELVLAAHAVLAELNRRQAELDAAKRTLRSRQSEWYALWWQRHKIDNMSFKPAADPNGARTESALKRAADALERQYKVVRAATEQWQAALEDLRGRLDKEERASDGTVIFPLKGYQLREVPLPPFWQPAEPVVLIQGAGRSFKHGPDGRFTDEDSLFCRISGQTIHELAVQVGGQSVPVQGRRLSGRIEGAGLVPPEAENLWAEANLLDTSNADRIAALSRQTHSSAIPAADRAAVVRQQTAIWNADLYPAFFDRPSVLAAAGFSGTLPAKMAVSLWRQPWSPLFLDWAVTYYPEPALGANSHLAAPAPGLGTKWRFDGRDYSWVSDGDLDLTRPIALKGRTLLTPHVTSTLADRLDKFIYDHKADADELGLQIADLQEAVAAIRDSDLLSQTLSGFHLNLLLREPAPRQAPKDGEADRHLPAQDGAQFTPDWLPLPDRDADQFSPLRAGHFELTDLWVVDDFGQVFQPIALPYCQPVASENLHNEESPHHLRLAPRIVQPSRLRLDLLPAGQGQDQADSNPICGWLLANHLDQALAVYNVAGELLGEVLAVNTGREWLAQWQPAPESGLKTGDKSGITNHQVRGIVDGLTNRSGGGQALLDLLSCIDSTLWSTDPLGAPGDEELAVLAGRPLAVVQAELRLELGAEPAYNLSFQKLQATDPEKAQDSAGFDQIPFPVRLGRRDLRDDGCMGYYLASGDKPHQTFYRVPPVNPAETLPQPGYIAEQDLHLAINSAPVRVTLIADPRGQVHLTTGILPTLAVSMPATHQRRPVPPLDIALRAGPVLTAAAALKLPVPAEGQGTWRWVGGDGLMTEPGSVDSDAYFSDLAAVLREGWLRLSVRPHPQAPPEKQS